MSSPSITVPEALEVPTFPAASLERRFYAYVLDRLIGWFLVAGIGVLTWLLTDSDVWVTVLVTVAAWVLIGGIFSLVAGLSGLTPGMAALGLRLVHHGTGTPVGPGMGLARGAILGIAALPTIGLGIATLTWTATMDPVRQRRGWHDHLAHSLIVDIRPEVEDEVEEAPRHIVNLTAMRLVPVSAMEPPRSEVEDASRPAVGSKPIESPVSQPGAHRVGAPPAPQRVPPPYQGPGPAVPGQTPAKHASSMPAPPMPAPPTPAPPMPAPPTPAPPMPAPPTPAAPAARAPEVGPPPGSVPGGAPGMPPAPYSAPQHRAPQHRAPQPSPPASPPASPPPPAAQPKAPATSEVHETSTQALRRPVVSSLRWRVTFDNGETFVVEGLCLIGRRPEARQGEAVRHIVALSSQDMSLSKTHAQVHLAPDGELVVMDRGSTNGSVLRRGEVSRILSAGKPTTLIDGDRVNFGDRKMTVRRES